MRHSILWLMSASLLWTSCSRRAEITPELAQQMQLHRNLGLAYLEEGKLQNAANEFETLTRIAPHEALGFANLGLVHLRLGQYAPAAAAVQQALQLAPQRPDLQLLLAQIYTTNEQNEAAQRTLEAALQNHPQHVRCLYLLTRLLLRAASPAAIVQAEQYLNTIVSSSPANVAANLELSEVQLRNGKSAEALQNLETLRQILPALPEELQTLLQQSIAAAQNANMETALAATRKFHNGLKANAFYQAALTELQGSGGAMLGEPMRRFVQEQAVQARERNALPAALRFTALPSSTIPLAAVPTSPEEMPAIIFAHADFDGDGDQDLFVSQWQPQTQHSVQYLFANDRGAFSDIAAQAGVAHEGRDLSALFADYDNDGYLDLFITNTVAHRLYHNTGRGSFVVAPAKITTPAPARAALFADFDLEGDLDLLITTANGNVLYRNNADGTFTEIAEEAGLRGSNNSGKAVFADFDDDGDLDLFVAHASGSNQYFDNLRQGFFRETAMAVGLAATAGARAAAAGDFNNDGYIDLCLTSASGQPALYRNRGDGTFERNAAADSAFAGAGALAANDVAFCDADNDGALDIVLTGENARGNAVCLFYNNGAGVFSNATALMPQLPEACRQVAAVDYDNDGDLDLLVASARGMHVLRNDGGNINNYITVRLAGLRTGSGKNNFFGIGAKVEVKAGDLTQMRVMNTPMAHFGLGARERADVVRVVWNNGVAQNWLNPERNQTITEEQILKGSCPWLYAWNGTRYEFVTDVLWTSALGMPLGIMGKGMGYAFANSGQDYFKIPGEKLAPCAENYMLQFTSELWEASFVDRIALFAVDHPDSVEIFVDEKFTPPPYPPLRVYAVAQPRVPRSARDEHGNDVLPQLRRADGEYVATFAPGAYQGLTAPHELLLDLGDLAHADSIFLFMQGWIFPTDASINVNTSQGNAAKATPPSLQVVNAKGEWQTAIASMGFPKGKNKTLVFDLSGKFPARDYRIRIQTNMQIYWDQIFCATTVRAANVQLRPLPLTRAELHARGFSEVRRATPYSPHIPDYAVVSTQPKWRDLTGAYTRYGEVTPLLAHAESKYVIMNAGDEMTLTFEANAAANLPAGWKRDFIFYNDGWVKDGDLNTAHGQTVEPLPFQAMTAYPYGPQDAYPRAAEYANFRAEYLTRSVTATPFKRALYAK